MLRRLRSERAATELGRILRPLGCATTYATTIRRYLAYEGLWRVHQGGPRMLVEPSDFAAFVLALASPHVRQQDIGPVTRRVAELVPREQSGAGGALCARLAAIAGDEASFFMLPGETFGASVAWLIEQLAQPDGAELAAALAEAEFALRVEHLPAPFGPVASIALKDGGEEVITLYTPRAIDWCTPRASGIVPATTIGIDLIEQIAALLRMEEPMAQAA